MEILYNKINKKVTRGGVISASRGNQHTERVFIGRPVKIPAVTERNSGGTGGGWLFYFFVSGEYLAAALDSL